MMVSLKPFGSIGNNLNFLKHFKGRFEVSSSYDCIVVYSWKLSLKNRYFQNPELISDLVWNVPDNIAKEGVAGAQFNQTQQGFEDPKVGDDNLFQRS